MCQVLGQAGSCVPPSALTALPIRERSGTQHGSRAALNPEWRQEATGTGRGGGVGGNPEAGSVGPGERVRLSTKHGALPGRSLPLLCGPSSGVSSAAGAGRHQWVRAALECGEPEQEGGGRAVSRSRNALTGCLLTAAAAPAPGEGPRPPLRPGLSAPPSHEQPAPTGTQLLSCSESGPPPCLPQGAPGRIEETKAFENA